MNYKQNVTISTKSVQYLNLSSSPQREVVPPRRAPLHYGSRPVLHEWTRAAGGGLSCPELAAPANNKVILVPDGGKYQNCHLVLKGSFWFFLVLFLVLFSSVFGSLVLFQFLY